MFIKKILQLLEKSVLKEEQSFKNDLINHGNKKWKEALSLPERSGKRIIAIKEAEKFYNEAASKMTNEELIENFNQKNNNPCYVGIIAKHLRYRAQELLNNDANKRRIFSSGNINGNVYLAIKILNEAFKNNLDLSLLKKLVIDFRNQIEKEYDWNEEKECFKGTCQDITKELEVFLKEKGFNAIRTRGYYSGTNDEYFPNMDNWEWSDQQKFNKKWENNGKSSQGLKFPHWWIEVERYIIDVTEDQFHPGEENDFRFGIYKKPNSDYKKS